MDKAKSIRLFYTANITFFLLLYAIQAEAVCPACIAGAGLGAVNAFADNDLYRLGFWLAGFSYLTFRYVQTKVTLRKYGTVEIILPAFFTAWPIFYFIAGTAVIANVQNVPELNDIAAAALFAAGSAVGAGTAFAGTVGACVLKARYGIKIPFFRITTILTLLWAVSLI